MIGGCGSVHRLLLAGIQGRRHWMNLKPTPVAGLQLQAGDSGVAFGEGLAVHAGAGRTTGDRQSERLRTLLVAAQIAMTFVLLIGVAPTDPIAFTIVTLLLMAVGLMAAWLCPPAARQGSTRAEPSERPGPENAGEASTGPAGTRSLARSRGYRLPSPRGLPTWTTSSPRRKPCASRWRDSESGHAARADHGIDTAQRPAASRIGFS